jgi:hypothetical protein
VLHGVLPEFCFAFVFEQKLVYGTSGLPLRAIGGVMTVHRFAHGLNRSNNGMVRRSDGGDRAR